MARCVPTASPACRTLSSPISPVSAPATSTWPPTGHSNLSSSRRSSPATQSHCELRQSCFPSCQKSMAPACTRASSKVVPPTPTVGPRSTSFLNRKMPPAATSSALAHWQKYWSHQNWERKSLKQPRVSPPPTRVDHRARLPSHKFIAIHLFKTMPLNNAAKYHKLVFVRDVECCCFEYVGYVSTDQ